MPKKPMVTHSGGPVALESEKVALGSALRGQEQSEFVSQELFSEDFYGLTHRAIFEGIKGLVDEGLSVNCVTLAERSGISRTELEELAGNSDGITTAQLSTIVSDLRRISDLRSTFNACAEAKDRIDKNAKVEDVLEVLESSLYRLDHSGSSEACDGSDVMGNVIQKFLERRNSGGGPEVSTGLAALDKAIIGLRPGKNLVIAARPGMGKTALADTIRRNVVGQGLGAIQFSLEMDRDEVLERELAFQAKMNLRKIMQAKDITDEEVERVVRAGASLLPGRWVIDDRTYNIAGIRRRARIAAKRMARQGVKLGVVVLDYIQLAGEGGDGREQAVAAISRGCKLMAKELGCTVLSLSQLNRMCEQREDRRPMLSDLRESGSIEQDADMVGFIYREHQYDNSYPAEDAEFIIRKQRSGPTGTVRLRYNPKLVAFENNENVKPAANATGTD